MITIYRNHGTYNDSQDKKFRYSFPLEVADFCPECKDLKIRMLEYDTFLEVNIIDSIDIGFNSMEELHNYPTRKDGWQWGDAFGLSDKN
jgi:hypothetical protein